jgi:hypothetical protein
MELRITATELAEYLFCRHAWALRRKGARVSDLAAEQMASGDAYQAQSDERVERAVMRQKEAQRAVRLAAWFVVLAIVALVAWFYLQR